MYFKDLKEMNLETLNRILEDGNLTKQKTKEKALQEICKAFKMEDEYISKEYLSYVIQNKKEEKKKTKVLGVRLDEKDYIKLEGLAKENSIKLSELVKIYLLELL